MSNKRYRAKPGLPRNEEEAMVRAVAIELLDGSLAELEQEIAVAKITVDLYYAEARERQKNPTGDHGRWQVAPGVAMRANAMLRRLREKRDAMLGEAEREVVEQMPKPEAKQQAEAPAITPNEAPTSPVETEGRRANSTPSITQPARSRDPAAA